MTRNFRNVAWPLFTEAFSLLLRQLVDSIFYHSLNKPRSPSLEFIGNDDNYDADKDGQHYAHDSLPKAGWRSLTAALAFRAPSAVTR